MGFLSLLRPGVWPGSTQTTGLHLTQDQPGWGLLSRVSWLKQRIPWGRASTPQPPLSSVPWCLFLVARFLQPQGGARCWGVRGPRIRSQRKCHTAHCHLSMTQLTLRRHCWICEGSQTFYILESENSLEVHLLSDYVTPGQKWPQRGDLSEEEGSPA